MEERILAAAGRGLNEAISFRRMEPFDGTCGHVSLQCYRRTVAIARNRDKDRRSSDDPELSSKSTPKRWLCRVAYDPLQTLDERLPS